MSTMDHTTGRPEHNRTMIPARFGENIKVRDFISKLPLFNELDSATIDRIVAGTSEVRVPRGETLFRKGDPCVGFHSVVYGQVKLVFSSVQGIEKVVEIVGPGHSFGEALMFMEKPYIVSTVALSDSLLLHVSKSVICRELETAPEFSRKMLAGLSRRLHGLMSDLEGYSLRSGTQRVIGYLQAESHRDGDEIQLEASKTVIASRLNLTPEHFSRILRDLCEHKLISVSGRKVTILDSKRLPTYQE